MQFDPVYGPIPKAEFAELVAAPYGEATKRIRKYDPFYKREEGEKIRFRVEATGRMHGVGYVEASNQEEADKLADELTDASFDWRDSSGGFDIVSVELDKW